MSNIERKFESPITLPLKERLNNLSNEFPKNYKDILEKAKNSTIRGIVNLASELENRNLTLPKELDGIVLFSKKNGIQTIKLQEGLSYTDSLNETQHKALINGWVKVLKHISNIHKLDSENNNQRLSDKKEAKEHYKKSRKALSKLKSIVDVNLEEEDKKLIVMNGLNDNFKELKDVDLSKWEKIDKNTQKLDIKIKDANVSIYFNRNENLPFTLKIDGNSIHAKFDSFLLIKSLRNIFKPAQNTESTENNSEKNLKNALNKSLENAKNKYPEKKITKLEVESSGFIMKAKKVNERELQNIYITDSLGKRKIGNIMLINSKGEVRNELYLTNTINRLINDEYFKQDQNNTQLINDLVNTFPKLKNKNLKWKNIDEKTQILELEFEGKKINISFSKDLNLPFKISVEGKTDSYLTISTVIHKLKDYYNKNENTESIENTPEKNLKNALNKSLENAKNKYPEKKIKKLEFKEMKVMQEAFGEKFYGIYITDNKNNRRIGITTLSNSNGEKNITELVKEIDKLIDREYEIFNYDENDNQEPENIEYNQTQNKLLKKIKKAFPEIQNKNLKWEKINENTQKLNFKIQDTDISISFYENENKPFGINFNGLRLTNNHDDKSLIKYLNNVFDIKKESGLSKNQFLVLVLSKSLTRAFKQYSSKGIEDVMINEIDNGFKIFIIEKNNRRGTEIGNVIVKASNGKNKNINMLIEEVDKLIDKNYSKKQENIEELKSNKIKLFPHGNLTEAEKQRVIEKHRKPPIDKYMKFLKEQGVKIIMDYEPSLVKLRDAYGINGKIENTENLGDLEKYKIIGKYSKEELKDSYFVLYAKKNPSMSTIYNEIHELYSHIKFPKQYKYIWAHATFQSSTWGIDKLLEKNKPLIDNLDKTSTKDWSQIANFINDYTEHILSGYAEDDDNFDHANSVDKMLGFRRNNKAQNENIANDKNAQMHLKNLLKEKIADLLGINIDELGIIPTIEIKHLKYKYGKTETVPIIKWKTKKTRNSRIFGDT